MELGFWTIIAFAKNALPFPQVITTLNWLTHYHVQRISWLWMQRLTVWKSVLSIVVSIDNCRKIPCLKSSFRSQIIAATNFFFQRTRLILKMSSLSQSKSIQRLM
jgi:hypothetical protein